MKNTRKRVEILIDRVALEGGPLPKLPRRAAALPAAVAKAVPTPVPGWVPVRPSRVAGTAGGRLARREDLAGLLAGEPSFRGSVLLLERDDAQLVPVADDIALPEEIRFRHVLVVGQTGSGKTTRVILPLIWRDLADGERSIIVVDAKGDLTGPLLEMARMAGRESQIRYISFSEPELSLAWNPIAGLSSLSECREVAKSLSIAVDAQRESRDSPFFRLQAEKLVAMLIHALQDHPERCVPSHLQSLLDLSPSGLVDEARKLGAEALGMAVMASGSNHNAETVLLEATNHVAAFSDPDIALTTSRSEFDFAELASAPNILILRFPEGIERLRALHNVFIKRLFTWVAEEADRHPDRRLPRVVSCYMDEFASVGRLPDIERALSTFRSRRFAITAAVQSTAQLAAVYGDTAAAVLIDAFGSWILVPPVGLRDAHLASQKSGLMLEDRVETDGSPDGQIVREYTQVRAVLTPEEIALPAMHPEIGMASTLLLPGIPPFQAFLKPIFVYAEFAHWNRTKGHSGPVAMVAPRGVSLDAPCVPAAPTDSGLTNTRGMSMDQVRAKIEEVKSELEWESTSGSARKWWEAFEAENHHRLPIVLRLAEELRNRKATITEFFLAYCFSNCDNIQANLHYLDYVRLKQAEEKRRKEEAARRRAESESE